MYVQVSKYNIYYKHTDLWKYIMFALPVFEMTHPRYKKSFEMSMDGMRKRDNPDAKPYTYKEAVVFDPELPEGFVYNRGFNIEYELHPAFNKVDHDYRFNLFIDVTNKKSRIFRNRKYNKVLWPAPNFMWDDSEQSKPFKDTYILHEYGVADNAEQILSHYKFLEEDTENTYFVSLSPVFREHQPEDGGWRWHKWGQYIGCQKREGYEYLYDEKNIEYVIVYHVYRIKKVQPFAESENFIYAKVSGNIIQAYTKDTHLNCFTIDFKDREVTTHNTDESRDDTHIQLAKLPEDLNMDNFTNWIESTHQESWF